MGAAPAPAGADARVARALGLDRGPEEHDHGHDQQREVVGQPGHVAQRGEGRQDPLLGRQLAQPARPGQREQVGPAALAEEDQGLGAGPRDHHEADQGRDHPAGPPHASQPVAEQADMPGDVEELPERPERALGHQDQEEQGRQPGQQGPEPVQAGGRSAAS